MCFKLMKSHRALDDRKMSAEIEVFQNQTKTHFYYFISLKS